jgi:hypothetical protein
MKAAFLPDRAPECLATLDERPIKHTDMARDLLRFAGAFISRAICSYVLNVPGTTKDKTSLPYSHRERSRAQSLKVQLGLSL